MIDSIYHFHFVSFVFVSLHYCYRIVTLTFSLMASGSFKGLVPKPKWLAYVAGLFVITHFSYKIFVYDIKRRRALAEDDEAKKGCHIFSRPFRYLQFFIFVMSASNKL